MYNIVAKTLTCMQTAMTSWGWFFLIMIFLKGCLTSLATRLASTSSKNSGSTFSTPRIFLSTAFPSSKRPRSIKLLGVSHTMMAPKVRRSAGMPANPNDSLQPHPPLILFINCTKTWLVIVNNKSNDLKQVQKIWQINCPSKSTSLKKILILFGKICLRVPFKKINKKCFDIT